MTDNVQKLTPVKEDVILKPFGFVDVRGWGIIITKIEKSDENETELYVPNILLWITNKNGVTPIVLQTNGIVESTPEHAIISVFTNGEPMFGDKINPYADIISEGGEKIDTIAVVDIILEHEENFKKFVQQMTEEGVGIAEPKKVLH